MHEKSLIILKHPSKMELVCIYIIVLTFLKVINAKCLNMQVQNSQNLNTFNWSVKYFLYKHISIPPEVQSPFYLSGNGTTVSMLSHQSIYSKCFYLNDQYRISKIDYLAAKLIPIERTNKLKVDYQDGEFDVFCNTALKIEELTVLDCKSNAFISFYWCLDKTIKGNHVHIEGVWVFINHGNYIQQDLNYTYKMLNKRRSTHDRLKIITEESRLQESCNDIKELQRYCGAPKVTVIKLCLIIVILLIAIVGIVYLVNKQFARKV